MTADVSQGRATHVAEYITFHSYLYGVLDVLLTSQKKTCVFYVADGILYIVLNYLGFAKCHFLTIFLTLSSPVNMKAVCMFFVLIAADGILHFVSHYLSLLYVVNLFRCSSRNAFSAKENEQTEIKS